MLIPSFPHSSARISTVFSHRSTRLTAAFAIALGVASPSAGAQTVTPPPMTYELTILSTLSGEVPQATGNAINESGEVAGYSMTSNDDPHAVIFREDGTVIDLGVLPGDQTSFAYGINGSDQVTGYSETLDGTHTHAFLYSAGKMKDIGTAPGYDSSEGVSINDSGQIAGVSYLYATESAAGFLYSAGKFTNIANFYPGGTDMGGNDINASAQIAGQGAPMGAAVYTNGSVQLLNFPHQGSAASAINDSGQVTGYLYYSESNVHAFLYSNGKGIDIGALPGDFQSVGKSINAAAQIVGDDLNPDGTVPFLYTPGRGLVSLSSLIPAGSGFTFTDAAAINDKGQIAGTGTLAGPPGQQSLQLAYLLSPVFVPFSTLDAAMEVAGTPRTDFAAGTRVTLGAKSNGIDPIRETVILQLGGYHISIPPSSFVKTNDYYVYQGTIGTVAVQAILRPLNARVFLFAIVGRGAAAAALPSSYPVALTLTIGDDTGTEQIKSGYPGGMPTPAEICAAFGIPCK